jgi:cytochrome c biogenesis protein CcdA
MNFTFPALFFAGALTFLSPCVLPLVPIYLAMLAGTSAVALREGSRGKGLVASTIAFSLGLAAVFVMLGLAASAVGRTLSGHRVLVFQLAGLAIFLAGLKLMGFLRVPWLDREARPWLASIRRGGGLAWPFLFGAAFALGWSPCVGPVLGSVLAFAGTAGSPTKAALYLGTYALGLTLPLVAVSLVAPLALRLLDRAKRHLRVFELASGTLLVAMGLLMITGHESLVMSPRSALAAPGAVASSITPAPVAATCNAGVSPAWQRSGAPGWRAATAGAHPVSGSPCGREMRRIQPHDSSARPRILIAASPVWPTVLGVIRHSLGWPPKPEGTDTWPAFPTTGRPCSHPYIRLYAYTGDHERRGSVLQGSRRRGPAQDHLVALSP